MNFTDENQKEQIRNVLRIFLLKNGYTQVKPFCVEKVLDYFAISKRMQPRKNRKKTVAMDLALINQIIKSINPELELIVNDNGFEVGKKLN